MGVAHAHLGGASDQAGAIIATVGADGPGQIDDFVTTDASSAQCSMTVWAQDEIVVDTALTLRADELLFDVVSEVFFFERAFIAF